MQPERTRGSLRWIQRAVNGRAAALEDPILARMLPRAGAIEWLSPLMTDDFAEYRDAAFLDLLGLGAHAPALAAF